MVLQNNSSWLGEEVYLTEEDLVDMRLAGRWEWTIKHDRLVHATRDIIDLVDTVYDTTNLLQRITTEQAKKITEMELFLLGPEMEGGYLGPTVRARLNGSSKGVWTRPIMTICLQGSWTLFPGEVFYVVPK